MKGANRGLSKSKRSFTQHYGWGLKQAKRTVISTLVPVSEHIWSYESDLIISDEIWSFNQSKNETE